MLRHVTSPDGVRIACEPSGEGPPVVFVHGAGSARWSFELVRPVWWLSATVLAASLVPTTLAGHAFWNETDPQAKYAQRLQFYKNTSVFGGLLLAAVDTEGKPGLAWRARRAAADVRREAKQVAKTARREAKLAKAQLT